MHTRLHLAPIQARALAKLLRIQLAAYSEAIAEPGTDDPAPREWLTEGDLEAIAPLLPALADFEKAQTFRCIRSKRR